MLGVLGLTLNKQLDLQVLASHAGRALFEAIHLGRLRRIFQAFFAVGFALVGGWFGLRLLRDNWSLGGHVRIAVAGVLELTLFVIVRVASAERLARWIGPFDLEWLRNSLEFLGIATIFGAALSSRLRQVRSEGE